jgi:hypothetical protein
MSIASKRKDHDKWAQNNYLPNYMSLELEDYAWFPAWMRRYQMEYISFMAVQFGLYLPVVPMLQKKKAQHNLQEWTDCCTGASGPVQFLIRQQFYTSVIFLTDKYLQPIKMEATNANVHFENYDVLKDAIPGNGLITMFNALHHFSIKERKQIITAIAKTKRPLLFVEITHPTLLNFITITLATTIGQLLFAPLVQPFSWKRLFFTYLIPINLITITWDGWMSVIRSISSNSFLQLKNETSSNSYSVSFTQKGAWWKKVSILTGQPIL